MTATRYVVLSPFAGFPKGALLEHLPDQFWVDKGYAAKIEVDELDIVEHKPTHGRPRGSLPTTHIAHPTDESSSPA